MISVSIMNSKLSAIEKIQAALLGLLLMSSALVTFMVATSFAADAAGGASYIPTQSTGTAITSSYATSSYIPPYTGSSKVTISVPPPSSSYDADPGYEFVRHPGTIPSDIFLGCHVRSQDAPWFLYALKKEFVDHVVPTVKADRFCVMPPDTTPAEQVINFGYGSNLRAE